MVRESEHPDFFDEVPGRCYIKKPSGVLAVDDRDLRLGHNYKTTLFSRYFRGVTVMVINAALERALSEKKVKIWSSLKKSQANTI